MAQDDLRRRMADQRAAIQRRIARGRERAADSSAFNAALLSARSIAGQTVTDRAKLNELKDQLRKLEANLAETLSVQARKRSQHELISESISNTTATNEQLRSLVADQRAKRDEYASVISDQLEAMESREAESDANEDKNLEEAILWYNKFLGFQVVGGEGVKFVFNKIDVQSPDKEYSFEIKLRKERYSLLQCVPFLDGSKELVEDLNCNNDLFKFVRIMRERFLAATLSGILPASSFCPDTSSITSSSPSVLSVDPKSETISNRRRTRNEAKNQETAAKKGQSSQSATSPGTMLSGMRRSQRDLERR